jgi:hypothetical protein
MKLRIEVLGDESNGEINSLRSWLHDDDDVAFADLSDVREITRPGDMATDGLLQAIETAVVNKEVLTALIGAIGTWASTRVSSRRTRLKISRGDASVEIDAADLDDPDGLALRIDKELRDMT